MSMMIGNASKQIKQTIGSIDIHIISPSVERAYQWVLQYDPDAELKGDLKIVARGALSLVTKEAAQVRRNEFLQFTGNPIDMQIIGLEGRAELLREASKALNINPDKVVPSLSVIKQRAAMAQMQMLQQQQQAAPGGGQELMNGAPGADNFSPTAQ
jgi:beta-lactamase class A